ncbi:hypothetical protein [Bauldia sp.]|uniref:hypothetical protein n=1 Tax=Bauldia sp. TaxID=2575872 RepID=UPI003BAA1BCB
MADKAESGVVRLIRFLALGLPTVCRILAVALVLAAIGIAFFDIGGYPDDGARASTAFVAALLAIVAIVIGFAVPALVRRFLPPG